MSIPEIVSLVMGIDAVLDAVDMAITEGGENVEDWLEIKEFLEDVLDDIKASRQ